MGFVKRLSPKPINTAKRQAHVPFSFLGNAIDLPCHIGRRSFPVCPGGSTCVRPSLTFLSAELCLWASISVPAPRHSTLLLGSLSQERDPHALTMSVCLSVSTRQPNFTPSLLYGHPIHFWFIINLSLTGNYALMSFWTCSTASHSFCTVSHRKTVIILSIGSLPKTAL